MKSIFVIIFLVFFAQIIEAQNVGQEGDTLINYVDINGFKQGKWEKKWDNNQLKLQAYFVDDKPVGDLKRYDKSGNLYAHLRYDDNGEYAHATFFHKNGKIAAIGKYFEQTKDSVWKYYDEKSNFYLQESFKKGIKHGQFKNITSQGNTLEEKNYKDDILHGDWKKYYAEGPLMWTATYVDGKLEGEAKAYYKNGKVYREGVFVNNLMEGGWLMYSENGNLEKVYQYKKGVSPESEKEKDEFMRQVIEGKGKYEGPTSPNDMDWLRKGSR